MEWAIILTAVGLLCVFEGILPFLSPTFWRRAMQNMLLQNDRTLRTIGLSSMLVGLAIIYVIHNFF